MKYFINPLAMFFVTCKSFEQEEPTGKTYLNNKTDIAKNTVGTLLKSIHVFNIQLILIRLTTL